MATITLNITGDDTPTSVTVNTLVRADTGAAVPGATLPATMSNSGTEWTYPFAESAAGLVYRYTYTLTWSDGSTNSEVGTVRGTPAGVGRYATQSDVENIFGVQNVAVWSDMTAAATVDTNRVQLALDNADAVIDLFFRDGPYAVPLTAGTAGTVLLRRWAATLAGVWLYDNRGSKDDDKEGKIYAKMLAGVKGEMGLYKSGALRLDAPRRWPSPSGPIAC